MSSVILAMFWFGIITLFLVLLLIYKLVKKEFWGGYTIILIIGAVIWSGLTYWKYGDVEEWVDKEGTYQISKCYTPDNPEDILLVKFDPVVIPSKTDDPEDYLHISQKDIPKGMMIHCQKAESDDGSCIELERNLLGIEKISLLPKCPEKTYDYEFEWPEE